MRKVYYFGRKTLNISWSENILSLTPPASDTPPIQFWISRREHHQELNALSTSICV